LIRQTMARVAIVLLVLVAALALAWVAIHGPPGSARRHLSAGAEAPGFALPDQDGRTVRLADFRGSKTVVLAFYVKASTPG
jgi:cytochrome oxidase Cu insertion factor (SCO1/SenC/PrrC family)